MRRKGIIYGSVHFVIWIGNEGEDGREIELDLNWEEITELLAQIANSKGDGNEERVYSEQCKVQIS